MILAAFVDLGVQFLDTVVDMPVVVHVRGGSTGAVLGFMVTCLRVVSAIRVWFGNKFGFRRPSLWRKYSWTFVSTAPVAELFVMSFTVLERMYHRCCGVLASRCRVVVGVFTPDGTYDSVWDCVWPMIGRYTI